VNSAVIGVLSNNPIRGQQYAADHDLERAYGSLDELLADPAIDAVYISTTNEKHKAQTLAAAAAGKHVLCEKPLALNLADAREMVEACKAANVIMGTNHHLRNAVTHRKLRELVMTGSIGQPLYARVFHAVFLPPHLQTWRLNNPAAGGGVVLDITVHDADTLRFVLNAEAIAVTASTANHGMAAHGLADGVMGVMTFDNGVLAQFHDAFTVAHAPTGLQIHGTDGSLFAENVMTQQPIGEIYLHTANGRKQVAFDPPEDLYVHALRHFSDAIRGTGQPFATSEDGVKSLAIALAVEDATVSGQQVQVTDA
jgi:1,5-anhydro-D-fructose reductase (1,5-anhydro-D-mannitol-forming)